MLHTTVSSAPMMGASRLDVMKFLNEIAGSYPDAVSFASGRPAEAFFDMARCLRQIPLFVRHFAQARGLDFDTAFNRLAQYGHTAGAINDLVARQVAQDEGIACTESQILITSGCQEAMDLCLTTLCREPEDIVLVCSPTYIGITGIADLNGIGLVPISCGAQERFGDALAHACSKAQAQRKHPRVLYLVPNFDNPTGTTLSRQTREEIIAFCANRGIVILEDNPYGQFRFEGEAIPAMHALDTHGCVIYLGTYSKTICPSLRVGFAIVPERLLGSADATRSLMDRLSQAKSFVTVNTSQITQAMVGGILLEQGHSLARLVAPATAFYRRNRDAMVEALADAVPEGRDVGWNLPAGGFFLTVSLPFDFTHEEAESCARDYGVLTMPLSFFALDDAHRRGVRLAFSNVTPERIREGVARFGRFIDDRLGVA